MSIQRLVGSRQCTARNAYDPATALLSAFFLVPKRSYIIPTALLQSDGNQISLPQSTHRKRSGLTYFSTSHRAKQQNATENNERGPQQAEKIGQGGTFGNYEALQNTLRVRKHKVKPRNAPSSKDTRNLQNPRSRSDTSLRIVRTFESPFIGSRAPVPNQSLGSESGPPEVNTNIKGTGNTRKWQSRMQEIAADAQQLSQAKVRLNDRPRIEATRERLDYRAFYIDAPQSGVEPPLPLPWTVDVSEMQGTKNMELLDREIEKFASYVQCTPAENAARESVIEEITAFIGEAIPSTVRCETFGSQTTGLATPTSDIDIRLVPQSSALGSQNLKSRMKRLLKAMVESQDYIAVVMRYAKYPLISAQHKATGIDLQIVASPDTKAQQDIVMQYIHGQPQLPSVYMVLKTAFGIRGLIEVFNGGIGSYGLLMMLVAGIMRRSKYQVLTPGEQLVRFLEFYSKLDLDRYGVSTSPPKLFKKHNAWELPIKDHIDAARRRGDDTRAAQWAIGQRRLYQPYLLCLQDPANPLNDLGRKSNAIKHLQRTIVVLLKTLRRNLDNLGFALSHGTAWKWESLLLPLVGRCHEVYYERRKRVEEYGQKILSKKEETEHVKKASEGFRDSAMGAA